MPEKTQESRASGATIAILAAIIIGAGIYTGYRTRQVTGLAVPEMKRQSLGRMDYDWTLLRLGGEELPVSELRGKVIFLNFWAYWCGPCVAEMPAIQNLYDEAHGARIAVVPVYLDSSERTRQFLEEHEITVPVYRGRPLPGKYAPEVVPTTLIVAASGEIVYRHEGAAQWDHRSVIRFLRELADEGG
ncbi:MAG: TlpA family protein disulfide reductase [Planctomycetota bacterium]